MQAYAVRLRKGADTMNAIGVTERKSTIQDDVPTVKPIRLPKEEEKPKYSDYIDKRYNDAFESALEEWEKK